MIILRNIAVLLLAAGMALPSPASAQRNDLPARIAMKDASGQPEVILTGRRDDTLYARLGDGAAGTITYLAGDVKRITLFPDREAVQRAGNAAAAGNTAEAVRIMRGVIQPAMPYFDLPVDGILPEAFAYAGWLRREKGWAAALSVYRALSENPDQPTREQALAWMAYCHAHSQQFKEAEDLLASITVDDPRHDGFMPCMLAGALVKAKAGDDAGALDLAARAAALSRIDHELYPEAVYLAAGAYQRQATTAALEENRQTVVLRKAGQEEPPAPPMTAQEFLGVATNLYDHVARYFPASPLAAVSAEKGAELAKTLETNKPITRIENGATP